MFAMSIDFEKEFFDNINRRFDALDVKISKHNERHEQDLKYINTELKTNTDATQQLANHVAKQNGRVGKLEKLAGRRLNFTDPNLLKTARIMFISLAIIVVVIAAGATGLDRLLDWVPLGG